MAKKTVVEDPGRDDQVRDRILRFLFEGRKRRTRGFKTTEIERALKVEEIKQGEVRSSLPYLQDLDWIVREESERSFRALGGAIQSATDTRYRISAKGVDLINNASSPYSQNVGKQIGIHFENVQGTIIVGDNNVVSQVGHSILTPLEQLVKAVESEPTLNDEDKYAYSAELATLRAALIRPKPNSGVIGAVVHALKPLADVATIANYLQALVASLTQAGLL